MLKSEDNYIPTKICVINKSLDVLFDSLLLYNNDQLVFVPKNGFEKIHEDENMIILKRK